MSCAQYLLHSIRLIGLISLILLIAPLAQAQDTATNTPPATTDATSADTTTPAPPPPDATQSAPVTSQITAPNGAAPQQDVISDIRPPLFFIHPLFWLWLALAVAASIGLLILAWKWLNRPNFLSPKSAYDLTLEKLEKARALLREDDPVPYAVVVSETIRSYLGQRFQTPSTRRTTEEFLRMMEADPGTPLAEHSDLLRQFLQACDLVKFAKYQPTQMELEEVHQRAFSFVHATNPSLPQNNPTGGKS